MLQFSAPARYVRGMKLEVLGALAFSLVVMAACSDHHDDDGHDDGDGHHSSSSGASGHTSEFPSCQAIIDACHPADVGEGPAHDCHEIAHDNGTEDKGAAKKQECIVTCQTVTGADAGTDAH